MTPDKKFEDPRAPLATPVARPTLRGHFQIARLDHWVKNVFVLPGIAVALTVDPARAHDPDLARRIFIGLLAVCLMSSSNYVINELLDAPTDALHPSKRARPVPSGRVHAGAAYAQWIALAVVAVALGSLVSLPFALTLVAFWAMGCLYNLPHARTKDVPYLDVLTESLNNPLRLLAGWLITGTHALPPTSLLVSYWMIGCYFMAIKRFAEYRALRATGGGAGYRRSFSFYDERRLLVSITFYGSQATLFFGAFIMRYRLELILAFPLAAWVMATYLALAFKDESAAQHPERLYREPWLMFAVVACTLVMLLLLFVDVPLLHRIFAPSTP
jgi:4-hydroxybenzoate polyprenyltransferase